MDWYIAKIIGLFTGFGMFMQGMLTLLIQGSGNVLWLMPGFLLMIIACLVKRNR